MRLTQEFPIMLNGTRAGLLTVQDTGEFDDWPDVAELCHKASLAVAEQIDAYADPVLPWVLTVRLGGEEESRLMNRDFRHKDYATNVLSFPTEEGIEEGDEEHYMGDIFICMPVVRAEALAQGKHPDHHLMHMVVHGMLHLVGYDHEDEDQAKDMEKLETDILAGLGVPDPYADEVVS